MASAQHGQRRPAEPNTDHASRVACQAASQLIDQDQAPLRCTPPVPLVGQPATGGHNPDEEGDARRRVHGAYNEAHRDDTGHRVP
jgi:hypothetical protein